MTPDGKQSKSGVPGVASKDASAPTARVQKVAERFEDEEGFFDLLSRFQAERMDDQRCSLSVNAADKENMRVIIFYNFFK